MTRQESSMIHSAGSDCRLILKFWDGRTFCVKIVFTTGRDCGRPRGSILWTYLCRQKKTHFCQNSTKKILTMIFLFFNCKSVSLNLHHLGSNFFGNLVFHIVLQKAIKKDAVSYGVLLLIHSAFSLIYMIQKNGQPRSCQF